MTLCYGVIAVALMLHVWNSMHKGKGPVNEENVEKKES